MASTEERQMVGSLKAIHAVLQSQSGVREVTPILDRAKGDRDTGLLTANTSFDRIVVSVYDLKAKAAPKKDEVAPEAAVKKLVTPAVLTVKVNGFLTDSESFTIASEKIAAEGQTTISLPFLTTKYQIVVDVDGTAEYAVFGV